MCQKLTQQLQTKMGLKAKEIPTRLCKMLQASYDTSRRFVQRHPVVSGIFSVFLILYIFLYNIYNFLAFLSPFILCTAIFIRIFWSSEQPQLRYVKKEKKRESRLPRQASKFARNEFVLDKFYDHSSHHHTSRRRNFRDKKWGLNGGSNEFHNAVSERNSESKEVSSHERVCSSDDDVKHAEKSSMRSEPSMSDLVTYGLSKSKSCLKGSRYEEDEDEESKDGGTEAVGWSENDHKSLMDIKFSELERNTRIDTLIANRRARKLLKMQIDKGVNPSHHASMNLTRRLKFGGPKVEEFDGTEEPDSAPSIIRPSRTFDHLYNPSKEKPDFHQEFTEAHQKNRPISRHASFYYEKLRKIPDRGSHDKLIEQLLSKQDGLFDGDESMLKSSTPQINSKEADMADVKGKKEENCHQTKSDSVQKNSNNGFAEIDQNLSSFQRAGASVKPKSRLDNKAPEKLHNFSLSNSTIINESLFNSLVPIEKNQDNMYYAGRRNCKTPTYSVASDLQVEVSEIGSPSRTLDGSNSSSEESSLYDGDNERDVTSGSDEMWGNSVHSRGVRGVADIEDTEEANNNLLSSFPLQEIGEENSADVSSVSSTCELPGDTPTCAVSHQFDAFGNTRETLMQNERAQPLNSSYEPSSQASYEPSSEAHTEKLEEWCNLYENYTNKAQDVQDENDSATIDKDCTDTKNRKILHGPSPLQKKSIDEFSVYSTSSPRSVLSHSNRQRQIRVPPSTGGLHPEVMPHNMQPLINDPGSKVQSHNADFSNSQVIIQTKRADEGKSDIEAKKDVLGNSEMEEKEVTLTKPAAGTNSVNAPTGEKPNHANEAKVDIEAKKDVQGNSANLAENEVTNLTKPTAGTSSISTAHMGEDVKVPKAGKPNDMAQATSVSGELPPEGKPHSMQHLINDPSPTVQVHNGHFSNSQVHSSKENEGESRTSMKQEPNEEPHTNAKTKDLRSANGSEGKHEAFDGNEARISSRSVNDGKQ